MQALHGSGYWAITAEQAMKLTRAAKNVARHYPMMADEKTRDWLMLGTAIVMLEGPKLLAMRKRNADQQPTPASVARPAPGVTPVVDLWDGIRPQPQAADGPL